MKYVDEIDAMSVDNPINDVIKSDFFSPGFDVLRSTGSHSRQFEEKNSHWGIEENPEKFRRVENISNKREDD
jgi:hypothetical protein